MKKHIYCFAIILMVSFCLTACFNGTHSEENRFDDVSGDEIIGSENGSTQNLESETEYATMSPVEDSHSDENRLDDISGDEITGSENGSTQNLESETEYAAMSPVEDSHSDENRLDDVSGDEITGSENGSTQNLESETEYTTMIPVEDKRGINITNIGQRVSFLNGYITEDVTYYALGKHGEYFFTPGNWTSEYMLQLIAVSESGIGFVKNWLGYYGGEYVKIVFGNTKHELPSNPKSFIQITWGGGGVMGNNEVFLNVSDELMPALIVHEATHAVLRTQKRMSNFPILSYEQGTMFFEEGLSNLIDYLFFLETELVYRTLVIDYQTSQMEPFYNVPDSHLHELALIALELNDNFENEEVYGSLYPQLMSYDTSASFLSYLLEYKGTKEDIMRVYDDVNWFDDVYSMSMEMMISEWLAYISKYR